KMVKLGPQSTVSLATRRAGRQIGGDSFRRQKSTSARGLTSNRPAAEKRLKTRPRRVTLPLANRPRHESLRGRHGTGGQAATHSRSLPLEGQLAAGFFFWQTGQGPRGLRTAAVACRAVVGFDCHRLALTTRLSGPGTAVAAGCHRSLMTATTSVALGRSH